MVKLEKCLLKAITQCLCFELGVELWSPEFKAEVCVHHLWQTSTLLLSTVLFRNCLTVPALLGKPISQAVCI